MNKIHISKNYNSNIKKATIVIFIFMMAILFVMPSKAYAAPIDSSSGIDAASMSDAEFKQYLVDQGFPNSYVTPLMNLHKSHPSWVFQAAKTGLNYEAVIAKESLPGINVVASSMPLSYRSKASGCYDPDTGTYRSYDSGGWYTATPEVIRYYMDPRNFFDDCGIFQFMTHSFDSTTQTKQGLVNMVSSTFLKNAYPKVSGETTNFATYSDAIYQAGRISGVNPYVIASIIIVEQGANGGGACISGTEPGYENIFNFFNIEAYAWGGRSAVTNGLIYAMGSGSYNRPWNTRYKSILGGGKFYYEEYVEPKQNTLYFKKFNVMNGLSSVAEHQYMSNVQGAYLEANRLQKAYEGVDTPILFVIPIYNNMAASYSISGSGGSLSESGTNGFISDYEGVNVRSDAGTSYSTVMTLTGDNYVRVTGSKLGSDGYTWFRISYAGEVGYVRSDLIKVVGWIKDENTGWHYYNSNGSLLKNSWIKDSVGWMWMDSKGNVTKSSWIKYNGEWYYLKSNGYMAANTWTRDGIGWMWMDSKGRITKDKWIKYEGEWYYLKSNGYMAANSWTRDSIGWMWMDSKGRITKDKWIKYEGEWYYLKSDGYMAANSWTRDSIGWMWMDSKGRITKDKWIKYEGEWYYLKSNGYMAANTWTRDSIGWMWMDSKGRITKDKWIKYEGEWYYLKSDGYMAANSWTRDSIGWMWMDSNGHITKSELIKDNEKWYYLKSDGYMATGWQTIDGFTYYFHSSGYMYSNGTFEINGVKYTFADNGALQGEAPADACEHIWDDGVVTTEPGCEAEGVRAFTCTQCGQTKIEKINAIGHEWGEWIITTEPTCADKGIETRYCIHDSNHSETRDVESTGIHSWDEGKITKEATGTETGIITYSCTTCGETMQKEIPVKKYGWIVEAGEWHYYNDEGVLVTNGWASDSVGTCWMNENGSIVKGIWITYEGEWYYISPSGYLAHDAWAKDSKGWMWLDSYGHITKDKWIKYKDEWYYLKASGYMAANEWAKDKAGWMYMLSSGKMARSSWIKSGGYWYYLKDNGYMATGTLNIDGKTYTFDDSGKWTG